jgi:hypothetical protein
MNADEPAGMPWQLMFVLGFVVPLSVGLIVAFLMGWKS